MAGRAIRKNRRNKRKKRTHERQQAFKKMVVKTSETLKEASEIGD